LRRRSAIHEGLVGARGLIGTRYLEDPALRAEYVRDIAPRTEAALARILDEIYGRRSSVFPPAVAPTRAPARAPTRAIDLGAGTGAAGRALRAKFGEQLEIVAVDTVAGPGIVRADLARALPAVEGRFDVVVAAHLLNELFVGRPPSARAPLRAERVAAWARALLAPGGLIVVVEPALRETSRDLLAVRDLVLAGGLEIVAPCIWTGPCPALARERDWCHDAASGPGGVRIDFSYLVVRAPAPPVDRAPGSPPPESPAPGSLRVVSDLLREKGRLRFFGCGGDGRQAYVRLDRHACDGNAALSDARRGDVLVVEGAERAGDGLRITAASTVTRR
jgi:SAM-dependent methyltransferase